MLGTLFDAHPYCTDNNILFLFLLINVLIVSHFGLQLLLSALDVNVNVDLCFKYLKLQTKIPFGYTYVDNR